MSFKSFFNRGAGAGYDAPYGFTRTEFENALGRDVIPSRLQGGVLSVRNRLDNEGSVRNGAGALKYNTIDDAFDLQKRALRHILDNLNVAADSYYMLQQQHSTRANAYKTGDAVPLKLEVGITHFQHAQDQFDRHRRSMGALVAIGIDHRDRKNIRILDIDLSNMGLEKPQTRDQQAALLGIVGEWMQQVDAGEKLDPHKCRKQLMDGAGLRPVRSGHDGVGEFLSKIWQQKFPEVTKDVSREHSDRLKRLSAAILRSNKGRAP